jgi:hypothetical protein
MKHLLSLLYWGIFLLCAALAFFIVMQAVGTQEEVRVVNEYSLKVRGEDGIEKEFEYGPLPALQSPDFYQSMRQQFIASGADFIDADLQAMKLRVYKAGVQSLEVPIAAKGKLGSWFETPSGLYKVEQKRKTHRSSIEPVRMDWNIVFQGNYFIHGWPRYTKNNKPVETQVSAGCIRLTDTDAKKVYDLVAQGMPVLVYTSGQADIFQYASKPPQIDASSYFVADAGNRFVLSENNSAFSKPAYDFVKLINAFVVSEYLNFDRPIKITQDMIITTENPRLAVGATYTPYDLIYPLLLERSNEAAEALSRPLGKKYFTNLLNRKADALGMISTEIVDATGVSQSSVTTARDLYELMRGLVQYRSFILDSTDHTKDIYTYGPTKFGGDGSITSSNELIGMTGYRGGMITRGEGETKSVVALYTMNIRGVNRPVVFVLFDTANPRISVESLKNYIEAQYK